MPAEIELPHLYSPREYQMPCWDFFSKGGKRGVCVWHRRAGKDLLAINLIATLAVQRKGLYWHLLPTYNQGRKIVWDGFTKEGRKFTDSFPAPLVKSRNNTDMRIELKTGSIYQVVGTDDTDRLVGSNPIGCIFSEYSLHDPRAWDYIRPILAENGGWALFIYTARGKNHGFTLLEMAKKRQDWFSSVLTVRDTKRPDGTPVISSTVIDEERETGMPEELIQQEFYCSFDAPIVGAYYGKQMDAMLADSRITNVPHDPKLQVHTSWDLGIGDTMSIIFWQEYGFEHRVIDYYENSGEGLAHYVKVLKDRDYIYGKHYAPHDIEVRELGTGKSRLEVARSLGLRFIVVPKHAVDDGIEAVRNLLPSVWMDTLNAERLIEALRGYRKEWDEKQKCFKTTALHDWTSHPADAIRTYAWGKKKRATDKNKKQEKAADDYVYGAGR